MKKVLRITEAEVVAEFLKAEFYRPEFDRDRQKVWDVVQHPNLDDETENAIRRGLLFRRREHMWRQLPADTEWWEIEVEPEHLKLINIFPRAQWRRLSNGNFQALHIAERIRGQIGEGKSSVFLTKIHILRTNMELEGPKSTVVMIGVNAGRPVTVLEGNHRFVSSLLLPEEIMLRRLRFICGFSPNMEKCCWYKTDLPNLFQYAKNRIKYLWSRDADVSRLLETYQAGTTQFVRTVVYSNVESGKSTLKERSPRFYEDAENHESPEHDPGARSVPDAGTDERSSAECSTADTSRTEQFTG